MIQQSSVKTKKPKIVYSRNIDEKNIFEINNRLLHTDWSHLDNLDVNDAYMQFHEVLTNVTDEIAPVKKYKIPAKKVLRDEWMNTSQLKCSN